jgi:hypothetical protein
MFTNRLYDSDYESIYRHVVFPLPVLVLGQKKNKCVHGHPTDPNFC